MWLVISCGHKEGYEFIAELDHEITLKDNYDKVKTDRINYLKSLLSQSSSDEDRANLQWDLINEYRTYQSDSTEVYSLRLLELGENLGSEKIKTLGRIGLMYSFTSVGYFKEANDVLKLINFDDIPDEIKPFFLDLAYRLYTNLESFVFDSTSGLKDIYRQKRFDYIKQLLDITHPNTYEHDAAQIELNQLSGQPLEDIIRQREVLLKRYKTGDSNMAIQYSKMALSSEDLHNMEEAQEYFAKSAIANIRSATKATPSAMKLAELMNDMGDSRHASKYIHLALDDAEFFGSQIRKVEIGSVLPLIENVGGHKQSNHNALWIVMLVIACVLLVMAVILFIVLKKRNREFVEFNVRFDKNRIELSQRNDEIVSLRKELRILLIQLKEASLLKDEYLKQSLTVNADFVNSLEQKTKVIAQQVKEKKFDDLKFAPQQLGIKEERQRIYKSFDSAFLKMFPNFIEEINKLLPETERFEIAEEEELPADLRIFALIRLGITDPAEIAKYLNLSVKTVYVYKTRLKTKSLVDNNEFENKIMSIPKP